MTVPATTFEHCCRSVEQIVTPECMRSAQAVLDEARAAWSIATMGAGNAQLAFDRAR